MGLKNAKMPKKLPLRGIVGTSNVSSLCVSKNQLFKPFPQANDEHCPLNVRPLLALLDSPQ
jgi:hypothetical protein